MKKFFAILFLIILIANFSANIFAAKNVRLTKDQQKVYKELKDIKNEINQVKLEVEKLKKSKGINLTLGEKISKWLFFVLKYLAVLPFKITWNLLCSVFDTLAVWCILGASLYFFVPWKEIPEIIKNLDFFKKICENTPELIKKSLTLDKNLCSSN